MPFWYDMYEVDRRMIDSHTAFQYCTGLQAVDGMMLKFLDSDALTELGMNSGLDRARLLGARSRLPGVGGASGSPAQAVGTAATAKEEELAQQLQLAREAEAAAVLRAAEAAEQAAESSAALHSFIQEQFPSSGEHKIPGSSNADPSGFWTQGQQQANASGGGIAQDPYASEEGEEETGDQGNTAQTAVSDYPMQVNGLNVNARSPIDLCY
eukprot:COSAG02_NODE_498_length_21087_cov_33.272394_9_plen_211_part_00